MDDMQKTMKHLQRTTEKLGNLSFDHKNPFQMLGEMQHIFDDEFWEQVERLNRYTERRKRNTNDQAGISRAIWARESIFLKRGPRWSCAAICRVWIKTA